MDRWSTRPHRPVGPDPGFVRSQLTADASVGWRRSRVVRARVRSIDVGYEMDVVGFLLEERAEGHFHIFRHWGEVLEQLARTQRHI